VKGGKRKRGMVEKISKNRVGLAVGLFVAILHAVWALIIAIFPTSMQTWLDWIFPMHFINNVFIVLEFSFVNALLLIVMAFIGGYIFGWIFAAIWDWLVLKKVK
jgi:hypothetical protein